VPTAFAADVVRRPIIMVAAWLIVLQAFLAGVATAQAAMKLAPASSDAGVICHGAGSTAPAPPDADQTWHLCCAFCATAASAAAAAAADAPDLTPLAAWNQAAAPALKHFTLVTARGAVRVGPSQAPPQLA
jgi:hypothetical protein